MSRQPRKRVRWKGWLRTFHIHVSVFGTVLILFFAVTGFILNHEDWFEVPTREEPTTIGQVPEAWLAEPDELAIVELLRDSYGVRGSLSEFEYEDDALELSFRKPGRSTDVEIDRETGYMTIDVEIDGLAEILTQIHMGKRTGWLGSLMIDAGAIILVVTALGGLMLWTTLPARRTRGWISLGLGVGVSIAIFLVLVL